MRIGGRTNGDEVRAKHPSAAACLGRCLAGRLSMRYRWTAKAQLAAQVTIAGGRVHRRLMKLGQRVPNDAQGQAIACGPQLACSIPGVRLIIRHDGSYFGNARAALVLCEMQDKKNELVCGGLHFGAVASFADRVIRADGSPADK